MSLPILLSLHSNGKEICNEHIKIIHTNEQLIRMK